MFVSMKNSNAFNRLVKKIQGILEFHSEFGELIFPVNCF